MIFRSAGVSGAMRWAFNFPEGMSRRSTCHPGAGESIPCNHANRLAMGKSVPVTWCTRADSDSKCCNVPLACSVAVFAFHCMLAKTVPRGVVKRRLPACGWPCRSKWAEKACSGRLCTRSDRRPCQLVFCVLNVPLTPGSLAQPAINKIAISSHCRAPRCQFRFTAGHASGSWFQAGFHFWGSA